MDLFLKLEFVLGLIRKGIHNFPCHFYFLFYELNHKFSLRIYWKEYYT